MLLGLSEAYDLVDRYIIIGNNQDGQSSTSGV